MNIKVAAFTVSEKSSFTTVTVVKFYKVTTCLKVSCDHFENGHTFDLSTPVNFTSIGVGS